MAPVIREATASDAAVISELNGIVQALHVAEMPWLFKPGGLSAAHCEKLIAEDNTYICVAECDGEVAGYIYGEVRQLPETELTFGYACMHIHHVSVFARHRRKGVAKALVDHLIDVARSRGVDRITSAYWAFNGESAALFGRCGMEIYNIRTWC